MKFALLFLMALVVISQQFYLRQPYSRMFWLPNYPPQDFVSHYQPLVMPMFENSNVDSTDVQQDTNELLNTQSRIRGFGNKQSSSSNNESPRRFLIGSSFGNNGYMGNGHDGNMGNNNFRYPFLETYTTTTTSTNTIIKTNIGSTTTTSTAILTSTVILSLTSVVRCVPAFQVSGAAAAVPCSRKKRNMNEFDEPQFAIEPSGTIKVTTTALPSDSIHLREIKDLGIPADEYANYGSLRSSQVEVYLDETPEEEGKTLREKRFFLLNRNYFFTSTMTITSTSTAIVPVTSVSQSTITLTALTTTTVSSFLFSNSTITQTVNLIVPAPEVQCNALNAAAADQNCLSCLPAGFVVCPAAS